jgi:phage terminase large subunit GpA-like protein
MWGNDEREILEFYRPRERLSVSEFSEKYRWLFNEGGGHVGKWDNNIVPYLNDPMDELDNFDVQTIVIVGPGQSGKTSIAENWLMRSIKASPGNFLWYMQTDDSLEAYVKSRINPMIQNHTFLKESLGKKPTDDSLHFKDFRTMRIELLSATYSNLINKSAPRIVADEIDAYPESLGNIKPLLDVRRQTFGNESKLLITSHPDRARGMNPDRDWTDGVMGVYADSDRRVWYWKCPSCGAWSSPCPLADRFMDLSYPEDGSLDEIQEKAVLVCPVNGCAITDAERLKMNADGGRWIATGQSITVEGVVTGERVKRAIAGFWVVGTMSPFLLGGIGALARAKVKAEREFEVSGEEQTLKEVMVKQCGIPYTPPRSMGTVTANDLAARSEERLVLKTVPQGVRFLTAAFDIQVAHFDVMVRGWGIGGESWIVDKFRVSGDPATNPNDWDEMINLLLKRAYPLSENSEKAMPIRGIGWDSGGLPGVTRQAYDAWMRWKDKGLVRNYGIVNEKEAWSALPMKGASSVMAKKLTVTYPDTSGNKQRAASKGVVQVAMFNPNLFKDELNGQLQKGDEGPWYVHFPKSLANRAPPHPWFEQLVAEIRDALGKWAKVNKGARNEALDLMVMTHVIAHLHGVSQIKWDKPPQWAAPWETNSFLIPVENVATLEQVRKDSGYKSTDSGVKIVVQSTNKKKSLSDMLP